MGNSVYGFGGSIIQVNNFFTPRTAHPWNPYQGHCHSGRYSREQPNCFASTNRQGNNWGSCLPDLTPAARGIDDNNNRALDPGPECLNAAFETGRNLMNGRFTTSTTNAWKKVFDAINSGAANDNPKYRRQALASFGTYIG